MTTHEDKIGLPEHRIAERPSEFICCTDSASLGPMAKIASAEGWAYHELSMHHAPMLSMPGELTELLLRIAADS